MRTLVDALPFPAFIEGRCREVFAADRLATALPLRIAVGRNRLRDVLLDEDGRGLRTDRDDATARRPAISSPSAVLRAEHGVRSAFQPLTPGGSSMPRSAVLLTGITAVTAILGLGGCSPLGGGGTAHGTQTVVASPATTPTVTTTATVPASASATTAAPSPAAAAGGSNDPGWRGNTRTAGCDDDGGKIPSGARSIGIADVDGDGQRDTLVLDDRHAEVGVLTRSGHLTMTRALTGAGPGAHSVAASYLSDGITALLADDGRTVELGYYVDCGIVVPKGVTGKPYTFALFGWGAYGQGPDHVYNAGVRCTALPDSGGQHTLSGVDLIKDQSLFRIRTTVVSTADRGVTAVNGRVSTTPGAYGEDDSTVKRAKTVDCTPRVSGTAE